MERELHFFDRNYLDYFRQQAEIDGKKIMTITGFARNFDLASELEDEDLIIDISSIAEINSLQYNAESLFPLFPSGILFIADRKHRKLFEENLHYCFSSFTNLIIPEGVEVSNPNIITENRMIHQKIIDLEGEKLMDFFKEFRTQIYGHEKFKDDFEKLVRDFLVFNKLGEHKILSLFLMGDSGVGKTEVARAIHKALGGNKKLAKVNFGNYSSDNALNSLIGSPRGYIGSEDGEIFIRVKNSDTGLILIDEFEKSNSTLFNYFLDVLESGKMSSSLSEDIDLNGFIIVFTSNISKQGFQEYISPELRSRFDYKGYFTLLYNHDKQKFVEFRIKDIATKFESKYGKKLTQEIQNEISKNIRVSNFKNMRDLNKTIKTEFVNRLMKPID